MNKLKKTFIIAEVGVNHNGSLKKALSMIDALSKTGADAIKFQIANPEEVYSDDAFKANYQKQNDKSKTILEMSKNLQISRGDHYKLKERCKKRGILYSCSAFDLGSLIFLDKKLNIPFFKIPSGEINSIDMIEYIANTKKKIFLSTGMSTFEEIGKAVKRLKKFGNKKITLLHCVSSYPAKKEHINLNVLETIKKKFNLDVGYSDHTIGDEMCLAAVAMGSKVIEKHVTTSINQRGPDHNASMELKDFKSMVDKIRKLDVALGSYEKIFSKNELHIKKVARKSIVTNIALNKGTKIKRSDLKYKRPGTGISPLMINRIIGKKIKISLKKNRVLKYKHIK